MNIGSSRSAYVEIAAGGCLNNPDKSGSVAMGVGSGATGVLKIDRGGTCTPYSTTVGNEGVGLLLIDGGTNRTARTTYVGKTNGASGEIRICGGGEFYGGTSESEIGGYGSATIHVVNGTFSHSLSAFGVNETGSGVVWVMGSGEMSSQNNSITLGREGTGIVYMRGGTWKKTGTAAVTLRVRERTGAFGLVSGWGEITTSKKYTIDNNGLVVANGMDDSGVAEERTLAYSATGDLSYFTNSLENVTTNGWYAVNKGKLTMQVLASEVILKPLGEWVSDVKTGILGVRTSV